MFYKAIVQSTLLYGCEMWVITPQIQQSLDGFHHRIARSITHRKARLVGDKWVYPLIGPVLAEAGLRPMSEYVANRRRTIGYYVHGRPIY